MRQEPFRDDRKVIRSEVSETQGRYNQWKRHFSNTIMVIPTGRDRKSDLDKFYPKPEAAEAVRSR